MLIDVIQDRNSLKRLRHDWDAVYDSDPEGHVFLSPDWFAVLLARFEQQWLFLAAKPDQASPYVAFCPLKRATRRSNNGEDAIELRMAGFPQADYTGLLCRPEHQADAIPAIARHIKALNWASLALDFVRVSESRMKLLLGPFAGDEFSIARTERLISDKTINNNICPFVKLPADWDAYLAEKLSANTRQKVRRFLKKIDDGEEFRITHADTRTYERDLDTLLRFWGAQWGSRKGEKLEAMLSLTRKMLTGLFEAGMLVVPVFWKDDVPLGAIALIKDERKRRLHFQVAGRDGSFNSPPPGFILHAHSIRWAIRNGYSEYDMMRGNEPYKYLFGCEEQRLWSVAIHRKMDRA